jgi:hypothetical protein
VHSNRRIRIRAVSAFAIAILATLLFASSAGAATPFRLVGKGTIGGTGAYAYIVRCDATENADAPFEVRFGSQIFRLTGNSGVDCTDDPAVDNPSRSFDTQAGAGAGEGTLTSGGLATIEWESWTAALAGPTTPP